MKLEKKTILKHFGFIFYLSLLFREEMSVLKRKNLLLLNRGLLTASNIFIGIYQSFYYKQLHLNLPFHGMNKIMCKLCFLLYSLPFSLAKVI